MEPAEPVETWNDRLTPLQRLAHALVQFTVGASRLGLLCCVLIPILLLSFLVVDIPFRTLDHIVNAAPLRPGTWLTQGHLIMALGAMTIILIARRFGGEEAARVVTASWAIAAFAAFAGFTYLFPILEPGDLPSTRFVIAFVASAMAGQYVAAALYDILRGSSDWWRAPFYALLTAFGVQVALFYVIAFSTLNVPWAAWMVIDFAIKSVMALSFLAGYWALRDRLKPRGGLGG